MPGVDKVGWVFFPCTKSQLPQEVNADIKMSEKSNDSSQAPAGQ
jgi:hypothetical protein